MRDLVGLFKATRSEINLFYLLVLLALAGGINFSSAPLAASQDRYSEQQLATVGNWTLFENYDNVAKNGWCTAIGVGQLGNTVLFNAYDDGGSTLLVGFDSWNFQGPPATFRIGIDDVEFQMVGLQKGRYLLFAPERNPATYKRLISLLKQGDVFGMRNVDGVPAALVNLHGSGYTIDGALKCASEMANRRLPAVTENQAEIEKLLLGQWACNAPLAGAEQRTTVSEFRADGTSQHLFKTFFEGGRLVTLLKGHWFIDDGKFNDIGDDYKVVELLMDGNLRTRAEIPASELQHLESWNASMRGYEIQALSASEFSVPGVYCERK